MESQYYPLIITVLVSAVFTAVAFTIYMNMKKGRYDKEKNIALLEAMRASFEKQIYQINDKLVRSEDRWRDINHLLLNDKYKNESFSIEKNKKIALNNFLKSNGITEIDLIPEKGLVFVLTPFHPEFREDYLVIKDVCNNVGLNCVRGDESFIQGDIFPEMLKMILKADLIIANINGRNSNVLYELGVAQAFDKPVILISRQPDNLPIDIKSRRFLIYKGFTDLKMQLRNELIKVFSR